MVGKNKQWEKIMQRKRLWLTVVGLLMLAAPIYAAPQIKVVIALLETLSQLIEKLGIITDKVDAIQQTQLNDLRSRVTGINETVRERLEAGKTVDETLQLVELNLNQSLDMTYGMAQIYLGRASSIIGVDAFFKHGYLQDAVVFVQLHNSLAKVKIALYEESARPNMTLIRDQSAAKTKDLRDDVYAKCSSIVESEENTKTWLPLYGDYIRIRGLINNDYKNQKIRGRIEEYCSPFVR
jgi:hypothetical protein